MVAAGVTVAGALLAHVAVAHRPAEGYLTWARAMRKASRDEREDLGEVMNVAEGDAVSVRDIFEVGEPVDGPAYTAVPDVRDVVAQVRSNHR